METVSPCSELRLDHTTLPSARHRNSFHSSLRVNGTADIGIASQEAGRICSASVVPEPAASRRKNTVSSIIEKYEKNKPTLASAGGHAIHTIDCIDG